MILCDCCNQMVENDNAMLLNDDIICKECHDLIYNKEPNDVDLEPCYE